MSQRSTRAAARGLRTSLPKTVSSNAPKASHKVSRIKREDESELTNVAIESRGVLGEPLPSPTDDKDSRLARRKWQAWSLHANTSPFPDFGRPTPQECRSAYKVLHQLHCKAIEAELEDPDIPETIPHVLDAMMVAILCQATSWHNAKRAMNSMRATYGSVFAYDKIMAGGLEALETALRPGGLHIRKAKIIMAILGQVQAEQGSWDLDHLFDLSNEEAMKQLIKYKYMGPKSAFVVMGWCLKRTIFTVDTHVYRIAGLWGWRPPRASREQTQSHLDALVPDDMKNQLHFLMIAHGRVCPACRGGAKRGQTCTAQIPIAEIETEAE